MAQDSSKQKQSMKNLNLKEQISIDNFPEFEQEKYPNTPLSKEACRAVGCKPKELLYKPPECFLKISADESLQKMHFNFYEAKRKNLIRQVQAEKGKLAQEMEKHKQMYSITSNGNPFNSSFSAKAITDRSGNHSTKSPLQELNNQNSTKSFHSSGTNFDQVEKAREKYLRQMQNMLKQEQKSALKMQELENQKEKERQMEELMRQQRKLEEKQKSELKRQQEIEKKQQEEKDEKTARQKAIQLQKKTQQENQRVEQRLIERINKMKQKQLEIEQKRRQHQEKTENNIIDNEYNLKKKLEKKEQDEKIRMKSLENLRYLQLQNLRQRTEQNDQKRQAALQNMSQKQQNKINKVIEKQLEQDRAYQKYMDKQNEKMEKLRNVSVQRDMKINNTKSQAQKIIQENKDRITIKQIEALKRLEEVKKTQEKSLMYKRQLANLRNQFLEESRLRNMNRQNYQKQKLKKKLQTINEKTEQFLMYKRQQQRERFQINTESQIQRARIKDLVTQMSVRNKWDIDSLQVSNTETMHLKVLTKLRTKTTTPKLTVNCESSILWNIYLLITNFIYFSIQKQLTKQQLLLSKPLQDNSIKHYILRENPSNEPKKSYTITQQQ